MQDVPDVPLPLLTTLPLVPIKNQLMDKYRNVLLPQRCGPTFIGQHQQSAPRLEMIPNLAPTQNATSTFLNTAHNSEVFHNENKENEAPTNVLAQTQPGYTENKSNYRVHFSPYVTNINPYTGEKESVLRLDNFLASHPGSLSANEEDVRYFRSQNCASDGNLISQQFPYSQTLLQPQHEFRNENSYAPIPNNFPSMLYSTSRNSVESDPIWQEHQAALPNNAYSIPSLQNNYINRPAVFPEYPKTQTRKEEFTFKPNVLYRNNSCNSGLGTSALRFFDEAYSPPGVIITEYHSDDETEISEPGCYQNESKEKLHEVPEVSPPEYLSDTGQVIHHLPHCPQNAEALNEWNERAPPYKCKENTEYVWCEGQGTTTEDVPYLTYRRSEVRNMQNKMANI